MLKYIENKQKCIEFFFLYSNADIPLKYLFNSNFSNSIPIEISAYCKIIPVVCSCSRLHSCCGEWEDWDPINRFNHTSWVDIVIPTDCPRSVLNGCVSKVLVADCSVDVGAFVLGLSQISSFSLLNINTYSRLQCGAVSVLPHSSSDLVVCKIP